ncbi:MAG: 7-cyano-7-deazaguanine synthase QueC [bacterium]|nr:7-cyano-7-deazaguanine synthase QueC [bacterium]
MPHRSIRKSIVLLSGGLDSTVAFKKALDETEVVLAITFDYGQRAAEREFSSASDICGRYGIRHEMLELSWLAGITTTALVNRDKSLPELEPAELDGEGGTTYESARKVWVPNRNGVFINIAAAYAESLDADIIVTGFNMEEAATFPDNSPEFIGAINAALNFSTLNKVQLISPTSGLNKTEIVALGMDIDAPLDLLWSCYEGGEKMCGSCESCMRLKRALEDGGGDLLERLF